MVDLREAGLGLTSKGYPFEVRIPPGLTASGAVLSDQVKSLDWKASRAEIICRLPTRTTTEIIRKVALLATCIFRPKVIRQYG
jgi:mRNA-degrading endonuclease toxin of MazEF toxin-antitoxin module